MKSLRIASIFFLMNIIPISFCFADETTVDAKHSLASLSGGAEYQMELDVTLKGEYVPQGTMDIVLVIDESSSMSNVSKKGSSSDESNKTRIEYAKIAAVEFIDQIINKDTRIALVSFSNKSNIRSTFTTDGNILKTELFKIKGIDETNIQGGLATARVLLEKSSASRKIIILISDGAPTTSYVPAAVSPYDWLGLAKTNGLDTENDSDRFSDVAFSKFNYKYHAQGSYMIGGILISNGHQLATISEAKIAKDRGIEIYTVGINTDTNKKAEETLILCQNKGYFSCNDENIIETFEGLGCGIRNTFSNISIMVTPSINFEIIGIDSVNKGTAILEDEKIEVNICEMKMGEKFTLKYKLKFKNGFKVKPGHYYTNDMSKLSFLDVSGTRIEKEVPSPVLVFDGFKYIYGYPDGALKAISSITKSEFGAVFGRLLEKEVPDKVKLVRRVPHEIYNDVRGFGKHISYSVGLNVVNEFRDSVIEDADENVEVAVFLDTLKKYYSVIERTEEYNEEKINEMLSDLNLEPGDYVPRGAVAIFLNMQQGTIIGYETCDNNAEKWMTENITAAYMGLK